MTKISPSIVRYPSRIRDNIDTLHIDEVFQQYIPPCSSDEDARFEAGIVAEGMIKDPIECVIWNGKITIIDGHRRYAVAKRHGIKFKARIWEVHDLDTIFSMVIEWQVSRRNADPDLRAELMSRKKKINERALAAKAVRRGTVEALEKTAEEAGVSTRTVRRSEEHAENLDKLTGKARAAVGRTPTHGPKARGRRQAIAKLAKLQPAQQDLIAEVIEKGEAKSLTDAVNAVFVTLPVKEDKDKTPEEKARAVAHDHKILVKRAHRELGAFLRALDELSNHFQQKTLKRSIVQRAADISKTLDEWPCK